MKIFLIHGDDSQKSQNRLVKFIDKAKTRNWEIVYLDDTETPLKDNLTSASLFSEERFFIHRDFKKISKKDLEFINGSYNNLSGNLVLFADSIVAKTVIKLLPKDTTIEEFKLPVLIWKLMDSIYPGNTKIVLSLLHESLRTQPPELVIGLMAKLLKDLYLITKDPQSSLLPAWRLGRLKIQASKFKNGQIGDLISELAEIDVKSKTTSNSLNDLLDFVLIRNLE